MYSDEELQKMACISIKNYLNSSKYTEQYILENFTLAIKVLVNNAKNILSTTNGLNISSVSKGNQSISFNSNIEIMVISSDVKTLLPKPINFIAW